MITSKENKSKFYTFWKKSLKKYVILSFYIEKDKWVIKYNKELKKTGIPWITNHVKSTGIKWYGHTMKKEQKQ